jgi:hypothetical protein
MCSDAIAIVRFWFLKAYCETCAKAPLEDVRPTAQIAFYNRSYKSAFPDGWRMQHHLTLEFCVTRVRLTFLFQRLRMQYDRDQRFPYTEI